MKTRLGESCDGGGFHLDRTSPVGVLTGQVHLLRGDRPLRHQPYNTIHLYALALGGWLLAIGLTGCHGRAYNDVYSEHMAAEIRDLEDQLYEYDHQYRVLEQETQTLRAQNSALRSSAASNPAKRSLLSPGGQAPSPLEFLPRNSTLPIAPEPALDAEELPLGSDSILEPSPSQSNSATDELPSPRLGNPPNRTPLDAPPALPDSNLPNSRLPQSNAPGVTPSAPSDRPAPPRFPAPSGSRGEFEDVEELLPPTIDPGVPAPPPLPAVTQRENGPVLDPEHNLELNLSRIEIPSGQSPKQLPAQLAAGRSISQATVQVATEKVTDQRVVELAFHPSLTRAINLDDRPDDDGLYLVLQPKNERGQVVATGADLTIIVLDPARDGDQAKIGRWEYTAAEVNEKLQPIGSEQGIHLRLPWNGPDPSADRVIVFALFKFENGRQVMGEKEIFLSSDGSHKTVWGPRAPKRDGLVPTGQSEIAQAGYAEPAASRPTPGSGFAAQAPQTQRAQPSSLPTAPTNPVVRPASGTAPWQPAPPPF